MKKTILMQALLVAMTALGSRQAVAARESGSTLLVIPSRYTVVQFAFDVASKRSLYLLSYDRPAEGGETKIYAWDNGASKWIAVEESDVTSGGLFRDKPTQVVLVGDSRTLPDSVGAAADPNGTAKRVTSLNLVDIANGLDDVLHFSGSEWKWFAGRYGFKLDDRNAERRRWGRYGPPGGEGGSGDAVSPPDEVVMPVAEPEEVLEPAPEQQTLVIQAPHLDPEAQNAPPAEVTAEPAAPVEVAPVGADVKPEDK